ncbi:hypothetical protein [Shimia marina]|uniref:Uncharacterized protein n=1 Tax=Shimia marina TaxID=321267 RepID=A0A0P1ER40_9RHOB|nr:hypothetical protein [Shimia marina]CUH52760.1 hypothetical protein SHM7688_02207 [Shimia marina]SFD87305.1 hypothetical protein SAMN04488037_10312 [Shimia marina]
MFLTGAICIEKVDVTGVFLDKKDEISAQGVSRRNPQKRSKVGDGHSYLGSNSKIYGVFGCIVGWFCGLLPEND